MPRAAGWRMSPASSVGPSRHTRFRRTVKLRPLLACVEFVTSRCGVDFGSQIPPRRWQRDPAGSSSQRRNDSAAPLRREAVGIQQVRPSLAHTNRGQPTVPTARLATSQLVVPASTLGQMATRFRARVGESLATVERYSTPLEATTPSLEALQAYSAGMKAALAGSVRALPLFQRAVEIDPDFALAHAHIGFRYSGMGESALGRQSLLKAYQLRNRALEERRSGDSGSQGSTGGIRATAVKRRIPLRESSRSRRTGPRLPRARRSVRTGSQGISRSDTISAHGLLLAVRKPLDSRVMSKRHAFADGVR